MATQIVETRIGPAVLRTDREALTVTMLREFDAPRERVFGAFASCEAIARWWGPRDWTVPHCEMDFRPGGTWLYAMRAPAGTTGPAGEDPWESWGKAYYQAIERPERIEYRDTFVGADGIQSPGMPELAVEVRFVDLGDRTNLITAVRFATVADLESVVGMGMAEGLGESFDKLAAALDAA